jgi:hypothetical protein
MEEDPSATQITVAFGQDDDGSGASIARTVTQALRAHERPVSVHLELAIEEHRMGARTKRIKVSKSEAKPGPEWTEEDIAALVNEAYSLDYVYGGRIVGGTATFVPATEGVDLMNARMRRAGTRTCLAVAETDEWDTHKGTCVFDFIESRYKGTRAARRSTLLEIFSSVCTDPLSRGVTTNAVAAFARRARVRLVVAGPDGKVFCRKSDKLKTTQRKPVLAYAVANGHMFPVDDPVEIAYMSRFGRLRNRHADRIDRGAPTSRVSRVAIVDESAACDLVSVAHAPHIVVPVADLAAIWTRAMFVARRTFTPATTHGTFRIVRFRANGVTVYANEEYPEIRGLARRLEARCAPSDGIGTLARRFFESRVPRIARLGLAGIPERLRVGLPRAAFLGVCGEYTDSARCFDVRGCYASALRENGGLAWAVPGPFDEIEPYDHAPLGPGRYFVREPFGPATPLVKGDGWYYERYARWRVERGASVVAQQRARCSLDSSTFADAVDECRARLGPESKRVINAFIGTTFPRSRKRGQCVATTELIEARAISSNIIELDGTALAFRTYEPAPQPDLSFIYEQIVEGGWVSVDELRELVGGTLVAVKTDAVVVDFPSSSSSSSVVGPPSSSVVGPPSSWFGAESKWREEPVGARVTVPLQCPVRSDAPVLAPLEWTPVPEESRAYDEASVLVVGAAGTGKSCLARDIAKAHEELGRRVARVAPTNKAAANIKGITIHALFGITNPEALCDSPDLRAIARVANSYDSILVDEVFMCTEWMFGAMLALQAHNRRAMAKAAEAERAEEAEKAEKAERATEAPKKEAEKAAEAERADSDKEKKKVKKLMFILCGDPHQLPPVGDDLDPLAVRDSSCVHELCSARRVELTVPRRSAGDPWLFAACAELTAAPPSRESNAAFVARFASYSSKEPAKRALSFLNATAAKFNREQATRARRGWKWLVYDSSGTNGPVGPTSSGTNGPSSGPSSGTNGLSTNNDETEGVVLDKRRNLRRASERARVFPLRAPLVALSSAFVPRGTIVRLKEIEAKAVVVEDAARNKKRVARAEFSAAFDLAYCVTIHRAQCETIDEPYVVLDSRKIVTLDPAYARALLYVAASRATRASFVRFGH